MQHCPLESAWRIAYNMIRLWELGQTSTLVFETKFPLHFSQGNTYFFWSRSRLSSMAKTHTRISSFRLLVFVISVFSFMSVFYWCQYSRPCYSHYQIEKEENNQPINLLTFPFAWNHLTFSSNPPPKLLKIALFVKKWPHRSHAGGLERHASTLHYALAKRGHETHIFTASASKSSLPVVPDRNLYFHLSNASALGYLDQVSIWKQFQTENSTGRPFDVVHTESVALRHRLSRYVKNLAVSWHGIEYETIHSDILREIFRTPEEEPAKPLSERAMRVAEEVKFFPRYAHHVAISDHAGDILKRIYMIPEERVHIILNGVDEAIFKPEVSKGEEFRRKFDIPDSKSLVLGMAGRLVRDKGHPFMFEALTQMFKENATFRETSVVLVAGDGPWAARYRKLGENVRVLGPLDQTQLKMFYNAIDIFVNPTLRAQGLDITLLEASLSSTPLMATRLASITGSVIVSSEIGYTFSPTVTSLKDALYRAWIDGREVWEKKGRAALQRGLKLFTANKMASAYERLFLCISNNIYCQYQTPFNSNGIMSLITNSERGLRSNN